MTGKPKYKKPCQTINKQNKLPCKAKGILARLLKNIDVEYTVEQVLDRKL